jgi:PAS domain S-box-containing protein
MGIADAQFELPPCAPSSPRQRQRDRHAPRPDETVRLTGEPFGDVSDAVIGLDAHLRITSWNRAAERLYRMAATEVLGRSFADAISCRRERVSRGAHGLQGHRPLDAIGLVSGSATHVVRACGREIPVRVSALALGREEGERCYLAIVHDDTEHRQLAASLAERLRFEILLAEISARFGALLEDQIDGEIELWLRRLVQILDVDLGAFTELAADGSLNVTHSYAMPGIEPYPPGVANSALPWLTQEFAARRMVVLSRVPDDLPAHAEAERRYIARSGVQAAVGIPSSIAGSLVCVLTFSTMRGPRKWPTELLARLHVAGDVFANAIARRQAKERLVQKQHELAHVGRVAAMGELAAVIAHELDQPLTAVVSNAEAVRYLLQGAEPDLAEADDALKDVIDSAMRVSEIVQRERRLLRKSQLSFEPVDVNEAVREIELFIRAEARQAGARVVLELVPGLPVVAGDRVQLQQVILNLAHNAVQAMAEQPGQSRALTIRTAAGSGEVTLSVTDTGPPIKHSLLERMFEPFYTTKAGGLGMGLAISKSILDAHHGRIWATRNVDRGVTMHVAILRK